MTPIRFRNCSITRYPLIPFGFLSISIVAAFTCFYTWPTTRNTLSPFFSKPQDVLPEHSEVEEVRHVRIAIEEAGGSLSFYLLELPDAALTARLWIQVSTKKSLEPWYTQLYRFLGQRSISTETTGFATDSVIFWRLFTINQSNDLTRCTMILQLMKMVPGSMYLLALLAPYTFQQRINDCLMLMRLGKTNSSYSV